MSKTKKAEVCLACAKTPLIPVNKRRPTKSRGLCMNHFQAAARVVKQEKTTWEALEKLGLAKAPTQVSNGFLALIDVVKKGTKPANTKPKAKTKPKVKAAVTPEGPAFDPA